MHRLLALRTDSYSMTFTFMTARIGIVQHQSIILQVRKCASSIVGTWQGHQGTGDHLEVAESQAHVLCLLFLLRQAGLCASLIQRRAEGDEFPQLWRDSAEV